MAVAGAPRQSLRALQERLAARLASAQAVGAEAAWLAVELHGLKALFPLVHSGEIFPVPPIQRVPHTRPWFMGVAALRGGLVAVVDLGALLVPGQAVAAPAVLTEAKLVTLHPALGVNAAVWVDRLAGLRGVSAFVSAQPAVGDLPVWGQTLVDAQGENWREINLQAVADWPEFLSVAA